MSDITQIKTVTGEYSGFNDTVARESITELSGAIDYVSGAVTGGGGGGTTVVSGVDNGLIYISAEDAGAIYGKPYNGTYNGFFSAINGDQKVNNNISVSCPEPTVITHIAGGGYSNMKYKTSKDGEWLGPVYSIDTDCEFVSENGVVNIPISSTGPAFSLSAYEKIDVTNKLVIPPFVDTDKFVKFSDNTVALGSTNSATYQSLAVGNYNSAISQSLAVGNYNSAGSDSVSLGYYNRAKNYSQSLGSDNYAAEYSLAFGLHSSASNYSFAGGSWASAYSNSLALGNTSADICSLAVGQQNSARYGSLAVGYYNSANTYSLAVGNNNSAYESSLAMGGSSASRYSVAVGSNNSAVDYSQAFGCHTSANNSGMAIGKYNNITTAAFVVGNGSAWNSHSDAFVIFHDGSVSAAGKISANGVELGAGGGGGASYTGDAQGALDKVYANSGNWISTTDNDASALFFANKVTEGNWTTYGPILSAKCSYSNNHYTNLFEVKNTNLTLASDYTNGSYSGSFNPTGLSSYGTGNWVAGVFDWHLDYRGLGGTFSDLNNTTASWSALRNVDLGLTTGGTVSSISGHGLAVGSVSNIVLTSTLPDTPDANTLYLIPEA